MPEPREQFISEPITPVPGTFDPQGIAQGEPGLPARFIWRNDEYRVAEVLSVWKTSTPEKSGGEVYLRRHWWELRTVTGHVFKIYFERQRKRRDAKTRWFIYTVIPPAGPA
ncbi:MAG: hypothetical protein Kow00105_00520 [Phycisphaeraceae bacterium]